MKVLVFAEKPSVGKDIARILGAKRRSDGYIEGDNHIVTWGFGHLVALGMPEQQNPAWKRWNLYDLPMLPEKWALSVLPSSKEQFYKVKSLFNRDDVDYIVNAADAGREGELIFRLVYELSGSTKPFKRLWISSMTDEAIKEGFSSIKEGAAYDNLASAAVCRSRADWLVGINFTRAYTKKHNSMLTVGRVQTPTLALIVNRQKEIDSFVPQDYWEVEAVFEKFKALYHNPKNKDYPSRLDKQEEAEAIAKLIEGKDALVKKLSVTSKKQAPPFLYDLTSLQREANQKYGLTAAKTLSILQNLYEKRKVLTYPRTDSRYLSEDIFPTLKNRMASLPAEYSEFLKYFEKVKPKKTKRVFNNSKITDHHAIIPTEKNAKDMRNWSREEQDIYDLVARRFIAVFYPDYIYKSASLILSIEKLEFRTGGQTPVDDGWRKVEPPAKRTAKQDEGGAEQEIPDLKKGDTLKVEGSGLLSKKTRPPARYTEASLLQTMETAGKLVEDEELRDAMKDSGLGTPATRAEIIEKLVKMEYVNRDKKSLVPTQKGVDLITLVSPSITSPELTGAWEKRLSDISKGQDSEKGFMQDIAVFVTNVISDVKTAPGSSFAAYSDRTGNVVKESPRRVKKSSGKRIEDCEVVGVCPLCKKGQIIEGNKGYGCNRFREGCNYVVWKEYYGKKLTKTALKALIEGKATQKLSGFIVDGKKVAGRLQFSSESGKIELSEE
ncbi:MAG: DNA topoisomerase 3 [Candidatus Riflebacteria bacterium]|nr:DNA topoisomerase 3 [Candidatus Riflebacteria bacterium]